jgi:hypothetical protein
MEKVVYIGCSVDVCSLDYFIKQSFLISYTKLFTLPKPCLNSMLKAREEGIAGFFEDIPVLIVVVIATGIFLVSLVSAYVSYLDSLEGQRMHDEAESFCKAIRSYEGFTDGSREGVFSGDKLIMISSESMQEDFHPTALGFHYQVAIVDTSDYPNAANFTKSLETAEPPLTGNRYTVTTSILINVEENFHAAQLIVTIWG